MLIFPAIDLFQGKAVRLFKGKYDEMTVYSEKPWEVAQDFKNAGCEYIHIVDLEGAKNGDTPNIETVRKIVKTSGLKAEIGGGVRSMETVEKYLDAGVMRVILGTSAVKDPIFLENAVKKFGDCVAVGADILNGNIAIKGWTETADVTTDEFFKKLENLGVKTVICTDISKDGTMLGTNRQLYKELSQNYKIDIVASGGVNSIDDIIALKDMNLYGAIIGKAYYLGAIDLKKALEVTGC